MKKSNNNSNNKNKNNNNNDNNNNNNIPVELQPTKGQGLPTDCWVQIDLSVSRVENKAQTYKSNWLNNCTKNGKHHNSKTNNV